MKLLKKSPFPKPQNKDAKTPKPPFNFFGFTRDHARMRNTILWASLAAIWIFFVYYANRAAWGDQFANLFLSLLVPNSQGVSRGSAIVIFAAFVFRSAFSLTVFKYIALLWLGRVLARAVAAKYLTDVFELEDDSAAWFFIGRAAFASKYQTITIREGALEGKDKKSPIALIGGPGYVRVHLDSAALFEKANGEPNVIGPTTQSKMLEGFERLREIAEEQYAIVDLRDQTLLTISCSNRSRDGIRVKTYDIKALFSVDRGGQQPTIQIPYPFSTEAMLSLVYDQTASVGAPPKSFQWTGNMAGMIRGELGKLVTSRSLGEILASIGALELYENTKIQSDINSVTQQLAPGIELKNPDQKPMPSFISRPKITALFTNDGFKQRARGRGLELAWVDVGTWEIPSSIILENHLEAWQLAKKNLARRAALESEKNDIYAKELVNLIRSVVTDRFARQKGMKGKEAIIRDMLMAYRTELHAAKKLYDLQGKKMSKKLAASLSHLNSIIDVMPHSV